MNRRHFIATAAAVPAAAAVAALPAAAALAPACKVDRAEFANRLMQWCLSVPEMGARIDAMLEDVDAVLSTPEGAEMLMEASAVCHERSGLQISIDWLTGLDQYPNGEPCRRFCVEPEMTRGEYNTKFAAACQRLGEREVKWAILIVRAIAERDYRTAVTMSRLSFADLGLHVEKW